jgi:DNA-directed RNA polymerase subunit beta'
MTTGNIFSPANGSPMVGPSQDMVMGNYYLTVTLEDLNPAAAPSVSARSLAVLRDEFEAMMAYDTGKIGLHDKIRVRIARKMVREKSGEIQIAEELPGGGFKPRVIETTVGRCLFNDILVEQMPFYNLTMSQKKLSQVISDCFEFAGNRETVGLLDRIKDGLPHATLAGLSFGLTDLKIPAKKAEIISETEKRVAKILKNYSEGVLTERERYNQVIDAWTNARVAVTNEMIRGLREDRKDDGTPYLNPIYLMSDSGARGSIDQIQQLAGMRALMAKPSGEIIEPRSSRISAKADVLE